MLGVCVDVCVGLTVVLGVAQAQPQVVQVLQDLLQGQLGQFTAGAAETEHKTGQGQGQDQVQVSSSASCRAGFCS